jgi:hypothetical protein
MIAWPRQLPLSQPARQQLSRIYSDFRNNPAVAERKAGLLRWIQSSAFDRIKGIHVPVSEIVETSAADALNGSKTFARTPFNFPDMPPVPRFFSNALLVGTEKPSLRGTNAGLIIVTHEIDTESLDEFEHVLAWTRGSGDFTKSPFADLDRRLCRCHEYRGYSIVYSGRRSLHFHFLFETKHLDNAPWEADALPRKDAALETAALMQNTHNIYWDHARTAIEEILDPPRPVDRQMRSLTKWRRMPWAIRSIEKGKDCSFLNLNEGDNIPQLVIHEHIREIAGKNSTWLVPKTFSTCHPVKFASKAKAGTSTDLASQANTPEMILLLQEQCRQEWGSDFPKPVKVGIQDGQPIIKFQNHEADRNPSSYVLGDYRKLVIQGNNGPPGNWFLPDHMTAAEFYDFTARRCGATRVSGAAWESQPPPRPWKRSNGKSDFFSRMLMTHFKKRLVTGDFAEIRSHQREMLGRGLIQVRGFCDSYLIKTAEGFGKTTSHFQCIKGEMLDIAMALPSDSPEPFGCFACRSYQQAEQKADEFRRANPDYHWPVAIKSFNSIYRDFCEQENEQPIDRAMAEESTLSSYLAEIKTHQPRVFDLLENYRTSFWAKYKFIGGVTTLFTTHATIQSWQENHFTRLWHHPKFDPENPDAQTGLRNSFIIAEVVFDELEIDEFLDILPRKLFLRIQGFQETYRDWKSMARAERAGIYRGIGNLPKVETFDHFDYLMRLNLNEFTEVKVNFDQIPFGHGHETNIYKSQNGCSYHLGIRKWPFGNFRIGFLTTEMLTASVVENVFKKNIAHERAKVQSHPTGSQETIKTRSRRLNLTRLDIPDPPLLYPSKIPQFIDARARANQAAKPGVTQLAKEILGANPDAVVIANGTNGDVEGVQTFQGCKGRNDLVDKDIYIVVTHLAPDQYAELNVIGQWLGIPNIINLFYMDQINQAVGRNQGFRQSNQRETKTVLISSKRLFDSVISKCCSEEGSRTVLYEVNDRPW